MKLPKGKEEIVKLLDRYRYVLLLLVVGFCLVAWPADGEQEEKGPPPAEFSEQQWLEAEQARLAHALSSIEGVGETRVILTMSGGTRTVYATDSDGEEQETVIVSAGSGSEQPVTVQRFGPSLQGALVICQGGGNASVKLQILQAVEALTGLDANQISICKGMGGDQT
ncbi:MAG: stage III sporulation protein AG [Oscillospiraceae bacterium]|nr:stage III sporulation protein AG [Oscillospiraceae bacterium]